MKRTVKLRALAAGLGLALAGSLLPANGSPLSGTWHNSYCSRVDLAVDANGIVTGLYTSHTGSTGSSEVIGWVSPSAVPPTPPATNAKGIPFSLDIQWRLINKPVSEADGSWHWVSGFSGQYHPAQTISAPGQASYTIPETLELLNVLEATSTVTGFADNAPIMWPQTLHFTRNAPSYCSTVTPGTPVAFTNSAMNLVSGTWTGPNGMELVLTADPGSGRVTGKAKLPGEVSLNVVGLYDRVGPGQTPNSRVAEQGVALTLFDPNYDCELGAGSGLYWMAGGVSYSKTGELSIWMGSMQSTTWTDRFTQETLSRVQLTRLN